MNGLPLDTIAGHLHAGQKYDAAREVLRWSGVKREPKTDAEALEPLNALLYGLLGQDKRLEAAKLLWPSSMFTAEPRCVRMVWEALDTSAMILLQGASSLGKTYSAGVYFFLNWLEDPEYTAVKVIGPSEDHLQNNLFSHLMSLHSQASIPLPGIRGDLSIIFDKARRERRGSITGVVVPLGKKGAGRVQGVKRYPRKTPHPKFGTQTRIRVLLDELEKIPPGIWSDLQNVTSTIEGLVGLKVAGSYNPELVGGMVHQQAEPINGWAMFDPEKDERWVSKRGWTVVRLDAEKCENVIEGRIIYPGLQTKEGLDKLAQTSGGTNTAAYATFGRGMYPVQGTTLSIIPQSFLTDFKARYLWLETPKRCAGVDSALQGDTCVMAVGSFGVATGVEFAPSLSYPAGRTEMFKNPAGRAQPRYALSVDQLLVVPPGDTIAVSKEIRRICEQLKIDPNFLILDITGNGVGVRDTLKEIWAPEVRGVNYSESSTHTKVLHEDTEFCDELYHLVCTELWYALRRWIEVGAIKLAFNVETEKLYQQLTGREVTFRAGAKRQVESKRDYKHRTGGHSPNEADAVTLLLHGVRMASGAMPGVTAQSTADEQWSEPVAIVSVTDKFEDLDTSERENWMPGSRLDYLE